MLYTHPEFAKHTYIRQYQSVVKHANRRGSQISCSESENRNQT